jgi:hypothetical protein
VVAVLFGSIIFGEYRINEAVKGMQETAREVTERCPNLAGIEKAVIRTKQVVEWMLFEADRLEDRYAGLEITDRQLICSAEPLVALGFAESFTAPQLRGMGKFLPLQVQSRALSRSAATFSLYYALQANEKDRTGAKCSTTAKPSIRQSV